MGSSITDRERANPYEEGVNTAIEGALAGVWTAMPGQIVQFDPNERQVAAIAITIQATVTGSDGSRALVTMPLLLDCPVYFPEGGGVVMTFPIKPGDECLVVFASRCIDSWWQQGGIQPPAEFRMHDLSDGMAFVGFRSLPNKVENLSITEAQLRSSDGLTVIGLNPDTQAVHIDAPGGVVINANVVINGEATVTGRVTSAVDFTVGALNFTTHKTSGVTAGGALSGGPVP